MDPGHLSPNGFSSWNVPVEGLSVLDAAFPEPGLLHPGGLAKGTAPHTPDQTRFEWPWRWAGRLISSWETSGKQAGGRSVPGAEEEGKEERTAEVTALGGDAGKSPESPGPGAAQDPPACLGCSTPCAAHWGDSLGGLGLINANSSACRIFPASPVCFILTHAVGAAVMSGQLSWWS